MKKKCDLCGFGDNSFSIEEGGTVIRCCKFCYDGYKERTGGAISQPASMVVPPPAPPPRKKSPPSRRSRDVADEPLSITDEERQSIVDRIGDLDEEIDMPHLSRLISQNDAVQSVPDADPSQTVEMVAKFAPQSPVPDPGESADLRRATHPRINDERITITSPEVILQRDVRPKTNLDVAVAEHEATILFLDAFRLIYHRISFLVLLILSTLAVGTVLAIDTGLFEAGIVVAGSVVAIGLAFLLMWFLASCFASVRRSMLLRIRQQEILFDSYHTECYRELKTKYTIIRALNWLFLRLSVILPVLTIVATIVGGIITTFLYLYWVYPLAVAGSMIVGIVVFWVTKFCSDCTSIVLDKEKNQQIQQQTLLEILAELRKSK